MNREIKFKAKRKDNQEWVYGNLVYIKWCNEYYIIDFNTNIYNENKFGDIKELDIVEIIPETICQYTELKDKNGVEIYENDIVKNDEFTLTVVYNPRETKFALMDKETFIDQCSDTLSDCDDIEETFVDDKYFEYSCGSYEVIENIYDKEVK